ncbi:helix-turn-helix domain-containing protein [uncultured Paracoccus sp.]|uniref:helix-turn-helix domain-containing protein n=1 Tax=uncultured Paracoccus sp. TaxID=189685 RepID=UPI00345230DE
MTGAAIAAKLGLARSTVSRWLRREGLGRLARLDPPRTVAAIPARTAGRADPPGYQEAGPVRAVRPPRHRNAVRLPQPQRGLRLRACRGRCR